MGQSLAPLPIDNAGSQYWCEWYQLSSFMGVKTSPTELWMQSKFTHFNTSQKNSKYIKSLVSCLSQWMIYLSTSSLPSTWMVDYGCWKKKRQRETMWELFLKINIKCGMIFSKKPSMWLIRIGMPVKNDLRLYLTKVWKRQERKREQEGKLWE